MKKGQNLIKKRPGESLWVYSNLGSQWAPKTKNYTLINLHTCAKV